MLAQYASSHYQDSLIISQSGFSHNTSVQSIIASDYWALPMTNPRHHHLDASLVYWLSNFDFPTFDLIKQDRIAWNGTSDHKVKTKHIGETIWHQAPIVSWYDNVWTSHKVLQFAHMEWILLHGRMYTMDKMIAFGVRTQSHCYLSVGGLKSH